MAAWFASRQRLWHKGRMLALRSAVFNVLFYLVLIGLMLVGMPTMLFGRHAVLRMANIWGKASLLLLRWVCGTRVEFRGLDNVPAQACIIASKHQSFIEIIAFASLYSDFTFVLKRELTRIPLFGWYLAQSDQIAIDRASGRSALTQLSRMARIVLAEGRQVFIFPEGTRRRPGAAADYKVGVAFLYAETGATCVPVALNSGLFWPRRSFIRRPGTIVLQFLPPIAPGLERETFHHRLQDVIESNSETLMAEALAIDPTLTSHTDPVPAGPIAPVVARRP